MVSDYTALGVNAPSVQTLQTVQYSPCAGPSSVAPEAGFQFAR